METDILFKDRAMAQLMNTCSNSIYSIKPNRFVICAYLGEPRHRIWGCANIKDGKKRRKSPTWPVCAEPGGAGPTQTFSTFDTGLKKLWKVFWNWPEHHAIKKMNQVKKTKNQNKQQTCEFYGGILSILFLKWHLYLCWEKEWNSLLML